MNLFGLSPGELLLIGLVAMIVLGPEKLPEVAASVGKWIREFRRATEELTSQFADENPFTEIQKALALDDLLSPTVISTLPDAPSPTPTVVEPVIETPTTAVAPAIPQPTVPEKVKSYHFFGTPNHPGLDPEWIVGAPIRNEVLPATMAFASADDEWLHGVPVLPEEPAPTSDEAILDQILATSAELESNGAADTNGHVSAATLDDLAVEATPVQEASEETVTESEPVSAEVNAEEAPSEETKATLVEPDKVAAASAEESDGPRGDATLILESPPKVRRDEAHHEPAFVGGDAKGRISEENQP